MDAATMTQQLKELNAEKQLLAEHEPPPMDDAVRSELDEYVDRRVREGGAPPES